MSYSARLPGTIMETSGFADLEDPNLLAWNAQYQTVSIRARPLSWNWLNISVIMMVTFGVFIFGIYAFGGFDSVHHPPKRNPYYLPPGQHSLPQNQPALQLPAQNTIRTINYIVELGLEDLLNQASTRALNSGNIRRQPMEIPLLWKDAQGQQRYIHIKDLGNHQISIKGQNYRATKDNAKIGIMNAL
jgi:hypothetical protein